ncbi:MAG: class I SAM-dependent methyltransferase [Candidatus Gottesmanbacteria bacterium]
MTMTENANDKQLGDMGKLYDREAKPFADQAPQLVWWVTLGIPAYDRHLTEFYHQKELKILDLGCASGRVEQFLMSKGIPAKSFTGVEISPDQAEIARKNIPEATFITGDITQVKLPQEKFDLAISNMVLEFLDPEQLTKAMENTYKWLKPGGTFFFITTHPDKMQATSGLKEPGVFTVHFPWGGDGPNYYRRLEDFTKAVENTGFKLEALEELNLPPEAKDIDPSEYARYMQYPHTRLVIKATKQANV